MNIVKKSIRKFVSDNYGKGELSNPEIISVINALETAITKDILKLINKELRASENIKSPDCQELEHGWQRAMVLIRNKFL